VACAADRRTIELLLGEPVQQLTTIVEGSPSCEYIVAKAASVAASEHASSSHASPSPNEQGERLASGRSASAVTV
jgi:hypothetical protein